MPLKLYTWNVNGFRAAIRNGFMDWFEATKPDAVCLQETKATEGDIPEEIRAPKGYTSVWMSAKKKGYSGTAVFYKNRKAPEDVRPMGIADFDDEGRVQLIEYPDFVLVNAYWPNSQPERKRLAYKLEFGDAMRKLTKQIKKSGKSVIHCGDMNIAHQAIDLARPKTNENTPGYYIEEREFMTSFLGDGLVDVFRENHPDEEGHYSWWSYRANARANNVGWRLDYHLATECIVPRIKKTTIHHDVTGSDHCPVSLELK